MNDKGWYDFPIFHNLYLYLYDYKKYIILFKDKEGDKIESAKNKVSEFLTEAQEKGQIYL